MVRFARADGSKGSNKRQLEEPTPWTEMVAQLDSGKKKKKSKTESENGESVGTSELTAKKEMKNAVTEEQAKQSPVKKNKNAKKKGMKNSEPQYTITPEGKRVKVFRDGTQRTWFDLPYEEGDRMTRYDGMWVKKEMTGELDRLKTALQEEGLSKKEMMKKMMKAKRKAHQQLRIELIYEQKSLVSEATGKLGKGETVSKKAKGKKKNNGTISPKKKKNQKPLTADNGCESSQEKTSSVEVNKSECNLEDEGDAGKLVSTKEEPMDADNDAGGEDDVKAVVTSHAKGRVKGNKETKKTCKEIQTNKETNIGKLREEDSVVEKEKKLQKDQFSTEMVPSHVAGEDNIEAEAKNIKSGERKTEEEILTQNFNKINHDSSSLPVFEENEVVTKYGVYWVLREDVESLEAAKKTQLEAIYAARKNKNANSQAELTKEEKLTLQRAMKKKKRFYNRRLLGRLSDKEKKDDGSVIKKEKKNDSDEVVKFDGFWVKKEAADRLHNLRNKLCKEGLSPLEVDKVMLKERRKEERALKNERKMVCLNCRQPGHLVLTCPNIAQAEAVICYTCGSTEHISSACNLNKGSERSFPYATCYICKETGHISRQCPDNPRGLYPKGGACRGCGSVEHLAKDCPDVQKEKEECNIRVGRLKGEELEALDVKEEAGSGQDQVTPCSKASRPKVVQF